MKKINIKFSILAFVFAFSIFSCSKYETGEDNASPIQNHGFGRTVMFEKIASNASYADIPFFRTIASNQDQVINFNVNTAATDNSFTTSDFASALPTSVTIPAGEKVAYARINFVHSNLAFSDKRINFILTNPSETLNLTATKLQFNYKALCTQNEVTLAMTQDRYGSETTWNIKNSSGSVVWSGGPYTDLSSNTTLALPLQVNCLASGSYTLNVNDAYGDGMVTSASVFGKYELRRADGSVIVSGLGNAFTSTISHPFTLP